MDRTTENTTLWETWYERDGLWRRYSTRGSEEEARAVAERLTKGCPVRVVKSETTRTLSWQRP